MKSYKICQSEEQDAIALKNGMWIAPFDLTAEEEELAKNAADFWCLERNWFWDCTSRNDNGIDDSKTERTTLFFNLERVIFSNGAPVGYYVEVVKNALLFCEYRRTHNAVLKSEVEEEFVGGWGDITEYTTYALKLNKGKEQDAYLWRGEIGEKETFVITDEIKPYEYAELPRLKEVVIKKGVKSIAEYAFENSVYLEKVTVPSSVSKIGEGAFCGCTSLKEIIFEKGAKGVTTIEKEAFKGCESLTELHLPDSVKNVSEDIIDGCPALSNFTFPTRVEQIGGFVNDGGRGVIKCYRYVGEIDESSVKMEKKKIEPYTATVEETERIAAKIKDWKIREVDFFEEKDYATKEQKYVSEKTVDQPLFAGNVILKDGEVKGYYLYVFYNNHLNFMFDKFGTELPPVFKQEEYCTIGAYYYRPPHSERRTVKTFYLLPKTDGEK